MMATLAFNELTDGSENPFTWLVKTIKKTTTNLLQVKNKPYFDLGSSLNILMAFFNLLFLGSVMLPDMLLKSSLPCNDII